MSAHEVRAVKIFLWTISAVLLLLVVGHELGSGDSAASRRTPTRLAPAAYDVEIPADLGKEGRTPALREWAKRLAAVCEKRNWGIWNLAIRQGGTQPLGPLPYSDKVLANWREFERGVTALGPAPAVFVRDARWIARVNAAKGRLIEAEHDAVLAGDPGAVYAAERAYRRLSDKTNEGFLKLGLFSCGQFEMKSR
jgi:hypothetical protein